MPEHGDFQACLQPKPTLLHPKRHPTPTFLEVVVVVLVEVVVVVGIFFVIVVVFAPHADA